MGVVQKGKKIFVPAVPYYNKDQGDELSVIFIQKGHLDSFRDKKISDEHSTVIVDDSFQYGQNKEKDKRWLVYHDKSMIVYQLRFIFPVVRKLEGKLADFAGGVFKQYIGADTSGIQNYLSNPLRNF